MDSGAERHAPDQVAPLAPHQFYRAKKWTGWHIKLEKTELTVVESREIKQETRGFLCFCRIFIQLNSRIMTTHSTVARYSEATGRPADWFPTTHWTVLFSGREQESRASEAALEALCRTYWRPVYAYLRRQGFPAANAQDLTQGFFARFIEKNYLARLRHREGKFRSFLLTFLKRFLSDETDRARAQKRGNGQVLVSFAEWTAEERHVQDFQALSPDRAFDRRWAITLLERAHKSLRHECETNGEW